MYQRNQNQHLLVKVVELIPRWFERQEKKANIVQSEEVHQVEDSQFGYIKAFKNSNETIKKDLDLNKLSEELVQTKTMTSCDS